MAAEESEDLAMPSGRALEQAMRQMAADPAIQEACAAIASEFAAAEADGLSDH